MSVTATGTTPALIIPSCCAVRGDRSMMRSFVYGPRSLDVCQSRKFVTCACVGKGKVRVAALSDSGFIGVPSPIFRPEIVRPSESISTRL